VAGLTGTLNTTGEAHHVSGLFAICGEQHDAVLQTAMAAGQALSAVVNATGGVLDLGGSLINITGLAIDGCTILSS
jgi:hypothetical protein